MNRDTRLVTASSRGLVASNAAVDWSSEPLDILSSDDREKESAAMTEHTGTCLCGNIKYRAEGKPTFPHLCSCRMCQLWSGAPTVAWVEFPVDGFNWTGPGNEPTLHQCSVKTRRGFCPGCGSTICAIDDGYDRISVTMSTLDDSSSIKLGKQHSFQDEAPSWWPLASPPAAGN